MGDRQVGRISYIMVIHVLKILLQIHSCPAFNSQVPSWNSGDELVATLK